MTERITTKRLSKEEQQEQSISRSLQALNSNERTFVDEKGVRWVSRV